MVGRVLLLGAVVTVTAGLISPNVTTIDTCTLSSPCISGTNSGVGAGVAGISLQGRGVSGQTKHNSTSTSNAMYGVYGVDSSTSGIYNGGVFGSSVRGVGLWAQSTSNFGIRAISSSSTGIYATTSSGYGNYATSTSGIGSVGLSSQYIGLYGSGPTDGVYAFSSGGNGIIGSTSSGTAVYASSSTGFALQAHTSGHTGAYVTNGNGNGADVTGTYIGVVARGPSFPLVATDPSGNNLFWVDGSGNVHGHSFISDVAANASTVRPAIENTGTARLVYGQAIVRFDPTFARTIDTRRPYQVFLTPGGDTRGLYVAAKGPAAFVVREVQGGRGSFNFDYHIYATQIGHAGAFMAVEHPNAPIVHTITPAAVRLPSIRQRP